MQFLEDENQVLQARVKEIESGNINVMNLQKQLNDDLFDQGKYELAINLN